MYKKFNLLNDLYLDSAKEILKFIKILNFKSSLFMVLYYIATFFNAILEGFGLILIVKVFTASFENPYETNFLNDENFVISFIGSIITKIGFEFNYSILITLIIIFFFLRIIIYGFILISDGFINAELRKSIQEKVFHKYLSAKWEYMRNIQVGYSVNINGQEAVTTVKYFFSIIKSIYFFITSIMFLLLALFVSLEITVILFLISFPFLIILQYIFRRQSNASKKLADERNNFLADITDRLTGLMQIKAENNLDYHFQKGTESQPPLKKYEIEIAFYQAYIGLFIIILPFAIFILLYFIISLQIYDMSYFLPLLASVGVVGFRSMTQVNSLITSIANLSRLSGSVRAVSNVVKITSDKVKKPIEDKIIGIKVQDLTYEINKKLILKDKNLKIEKGKPSVLKGKSGIGKTTFVNLLSGLVNPSGGKIEYISKDFIYPSSDYFAKVGYVTQDIYLFKGSVRENLVGNRDISSEKIWEVLNKVNAADFINSLGGLDAHILESGKSLSGGQKRRLGISRVLLSDIDILILDEITAGLGQDDQNFIMQLVSNLSDELILILISHDEINLKNQENYNL